MASFKHRPNGKVQITITRGKRYDGKPCRYHKEVDYISDRQLNEEAALFLADIISGKISAGSSTTLNTLFNDFIKNNGSSNVELKVSTARRYETLYANQIKDYLGDRQISKITRIDIRDWVKDLSENGKNRKTGTPLSPKTIKNALSLLSTLFKYAIEDLDLIDRNPCEHIKVPKTKKHKVKKDFYNDYEVADLISCLLKENHPTHVTALLLILFTGMRNGEVMGLKWNDIDFEKRTITIERERLSVPIVGTIEDTPKTEDSVRVISIPEFIADMLKKLKEYQEDCKEKMGDEYTETGYVMVTIYGTPHNPKNTYLWFTNFQKKYGLKKCTVHDLRHTHAALLSSIGVQIVDVSKRLGHSNTRITQEVYEYYFRKSDNFISDKLDDYFQKCSQNVVKENSNV